MTIDNRRPRHRRRSRHDARRRLEADVSILRLVRLVAHVRRRRLCHRVARDARNRPRRRRASPAWQVPDARSRPEVGARDPCTLTGRWRVLGGLALAPAPVPLPPPSRAAPAAAIAPMAAPGLQPIPHWTQVPNTSTPRRARRPASRPCGLSLRRPSRCSPSSDRTRRSHASHPRRQLTGHRRR